VLAHRRFRHGANASRIRAFQMRAARESTVAEGLTERDVQRLQRPSTGRLLVMAGAAALSPDFSNNRAATAVTVPPTIGK
jgi:hypothetical protein